MARKGREGQDYRSEAERVGPRSGGSSLMKEPEPFARASDRVKEEVIRTRLSLEPELATSEVHVEVRGASVVLNGSADTLNTKYRIEELVKRIDGIEDIENNLSIRVGESIEEFSRASDAARLRQEEARRLTEKK